MLKLKTYQILWKIFPIQNIKKIFTLDVTTQNGKSNSKLMPCFNTDAKSKQKSDSKEQIILHLSPLVKQFSESFSIIFRVKKIRVQRASKYWTAGLFDIGCDCVVCYPVATRDARWAWSVGILMGGGGCSLLPGLELIEVAFRITKTCMMLLTSTPLVSLYSWLWKEYKITAVRAYKVGTTWWEVGFKLLSDYMYDVT